MGKAFAITVVIFGILLGIAIYRTGIYKEVTIAPAQLGPYVFVYKEHLGSYHKIVPVIEGVEKFMADKGLPCPITFGRYLDNPDEVEHDRLRSHGGCAFTALTPQLEQAIKEGDYLSEPIPQKEYVVARFNGSPSMGPFVVYPKMEKWFEKYGYSQQGPIIEIYQILPDQSVLTSYLFEYAITD